MHPSPKQNKMIVFLVLNLFQFSAFAASWLSIPVVDPMGSIRHVMCQREPDYAVVEDDILVKEYKAPFTKQKKDGAAILQKLGGGHWDKGLIPYMFHDELPQATRNDILSAIDVWESNTQIHFQKIDAPSPQIPDYVIFIPDEGKRCASYVGKQGGGQTVRLAKRCNTMNIVHELGHTIGLWHEQSRLDRDSYVKIVWENIYEQNWYNFNQHITDGKDYGDYDYQSIMHYSAFAFSKNNQKTIVPLQNDVEIGQRQFLSSKDIAAANALSIE